MEKLRNTSGASRGLPPPPPPIKPAPRAKSENVSDSAAFVLLRELGYDIEKLSPVQLVATLLKDMLSEREAKQEVISKLAQLESEQSDLVFELEKYVAESTSDEEKSDVPPTAPRRGHGATPRTVAEANVKIDRLEKELKRVKELLDKSRAECQRLASVANYASQTRQAVSEELRTLTDAQQKEMTDSKASLDEELSRLQVLENEIDRLRLELVKQEGVQESLKNRLTQTSEQVKLAQEGKQHFEEALERNREELRKQNELLLEERRSKRMMKIRLDEVTKENDHLRDELSNAQKDKVTFEKAKTDLEQQNGILKRQVANQGELLANREEEFNNLKTKLTTNERILEDEKKAHAARLHEVRAAAHDVANMTRENRELNRAMERFTHENRSLKIELDELKAKQARLSGMLDAAKVERSELLNAVRRLTEDKTRLGDEMRAMADARRDLLREERVATDEVLELKKKVAQLEDVRRRLESDLDSAERRAEGLAREVRSSKAKIEALEETRTLLDRSSESEQQKYIQATRQHESLRWELEQTRSELGICAGRLDKAMAENAKLAEQLVAERLRIEELESQVERARIHQAKALISSGKAFASSVDRFRDVGRDEGITTAASASRGGGNQNDENSSSPSTNKDFEERFEELERAIGGGGGDDLSEASSVIRQAREERRRQTPSFLRRTGDV